jgi:hypothetical protein
LTHDLKPSNLARDINNPRTVDFFLLVWDWLTG